MYKFQLKDNGVVVGYETHELLDSTMHIKHNRLNLGSYDCKESWVDHDEKILIDDLMYICYSCHSIIQSAPHIRDGSICCKNCYQGGIDG